MEEITIKDDFIKLGQALKLAGLAGSGVDAKFMIEDGIVSVNGEVELRRGRKVRPGDVIELEGHQVKVCLLYTSPSPRDRSVSRMPSSA